MLKPYKVYILSKQGNELKIQIDYKNEKTNKVSISEVKTVINKDYQDILKQIQKEN